MSQPAASPPPPAPPHPPRRVNPRLVAMLAGFFLAICGLVILTDLVSPRNRSPDAPSTSTAPSTTPATLPTS